MDNSGNLAITPEGDISFSFSLEGASPAAQNTLQEDFFWDPAEEFSPFGNDDGSDAAYEFRIWRSGHNSEHALAYLNALFKRWDYPWFDLTSLDPDTIDAYTKRPFEADPSIEEKMTAALKSERDSWGPKNPDKPSSQDDNETSSVNSAFESLGLYVLIGMDNAIMGTAFAQFVLEGRIHKDLKELAITAITRQLLPVLLNKYDPPLAEERESKFLKMLQVLQEAPTNLNRGSNSNSD